MSPRLDSRFWEKVDTTGDCWEWTAGVTGGGYGYFWISGGMKRAHRLMYEAVVGPLLDGYVIDHLCRNRRCVRPDHLEQVTQQLNVQRAANDECQRGHPRATNTYVSPHGRRSCRACQQFRDKRRAA